MNNVGHQMDDNSAEYDEDEAKADKVICLPEPVALDWRKRLPRMALGKGTPWGKLGRLDLSIVSKNARDSMQCINHTCIMIPPCLC